MRNYLDPELLRGVIAVAKKAGLATLPYFNKEKNLLEQKKKDNTVVTEADLASDLVVREGLFELDNSIPILTEETAHEFDWGQRQKWQAYWLVDPLDGTRGFVEGDPCYTVNIALIINNQSMMGVVYVPTSDELHYAVKGMGAYVVRSGAVPEKVSTTHLDWQQIRVATGHYHNKGTHLVALERNEAVSMSHINSSYKFCALALGEQDIYPKYTQTSEWDTAAAQVVLEEAGGALVDQAGQPLTYNTKDSLINPSFLALGDASQVNKALKLVF